MNSETLLLTILPLFSDIASKQGVADPRGNMFIQTDAIHRAFSSSNNQVV